MDAARAGGDWAWTLLYDEFAPAVLGYLRAHGAWEPEDLLGEVFVQVVRGANDFAGDEAGFRSWIFVIAHNRLLNERRSRARRPEIPTVDEALDRRAADDPAGEAVRNVTTERIRTILGRLPADQREVLLLRILGGLTIEEVARAIGKRVGAVKALQRRGLTAVRRELEREGVPFSVPPGVTELR